MQSLEKPIEPHFRDETLITHVFKIKCGYLKQIGEGNFRKRGKNDHIKILNQLLKST